MKLIWSLFDGSGLAGHELAKQGHKVMCFNFDVADHGDYAKYNARVEHPNIEYVNVFIDEKFERDAITGVYGKPDFIMAFPPCTDLAVSGARHFASKRERDQLFQEKAVATARIAANIGDALGVTYIIENPSMRTELGDVALWGMANYSITVNSCIAGRVKEALYE